MNEKIKQLVEQAGINLNCYGQPIPVSLASNFDTLVELIVNKCIDIANPKLTDVGERSAGMHLVQRRIQEHFGVEDKGIKIGDRIKVISGFNVGAKGTVSFIEPSGRLWVMRDGASKDVFYMPEEVVGVE